MSSFLEDRNINQSGEVPDLQSPLALEKAIFTNSLDSNNGTDSKRVSRQSFKFNSDKNYLNFLSAEKNFSATKPEVQNPLEKTKDFRKSLKIPVNFLAKPREVIGDKEIAPEEHSEIKENSPSFYTSLSTKQTENMPKLQVLKFKRENIIQTMIENAEPDSIVNLPDGTIRIPNLVLTKPMVIKGLPGTFLELTDGPIVINFQNEVLKSNSKVIFSEITIYADYQKHKTLEMLFGKADSSRRTKETEDSIKDRKIGSINSKVDDRGENSSNIPVETTLALFEVHSGSNLELRDCNIRSFVKQNFYTPEEKRIIEFQDVCVWLRHLDLSRESPSLYLKSTTLCSFHSFAFADNKGHITIFKSFLSEAEGHAISITNPDSIRITECIFDRPDKSALNVRFTKNPTYKSSIPILITGNEIYRGNSHGITIFGETSKNPPLVLTIEKNKLFFLRKDAIAIKFVDYKEINMVYNQIENSKGNGIYLHNVISQDVSSQISCCKNYIKACDANGLIIKNSSILLEDSEIFGHKKNGVFIVFDDITADTAALSERKIIINHCKIYENAESGLNISGNIWGPFVVNSCIVKNNLHGIFINEKFQETPQQPIKTKSSKKTKKQQGNENNFTYYSIEKCEILSNGVSGVHIQHTNNQIYVAENTVNMNKDYALYIDRREEKDFIHIKDISRGNFFDRLNGFIGGPWGEFVDEKPTTCKSTNCSIF